MEWVRIDAGLPRHPKVGRLARLLGVSRLTAVGIVTSLWTWVAATWGEDGFLGVVEGWEIAEAIGWDGPEETILDALVTAGFIDRTEEGFALHDWDAYQSRDERARALARERKRRERARKAAEKTASDGVPDREKDVRREEKPGHDTDDRDATSRTGVTPRHAPPGQPVTPTYVPDVRTNQEKNPSPGSAGAPPGVAKTGEKSPRNPDPNKQALREQFLAAWRERYPGQTCPWERDQATWRLLHRRVRELGAEEVLRRWRACLAEDHDGPTDPLRGHPLRVALGATVIGRWATPRRRRDPTGIPLREPREPSPEEELGYARYWAEREAPDHPAAAAIRRALSADREDEALAIWAAVRAGTWREA